jgi:hypothetical protein
MNRWRRVLREERDRYADIRHVTGNLFGDTRSIRFEVELEAHEHDDSW